MAIPISLSPETEAQLQAMADRQGQDVNQVAAELLTQVLTWESQENQEAIAGIQRGWRILRPVDSDRFRSSLLSAVVN